MKYISLLLIIFLIAGCSMVWKDKLLIVTLFKRYSVTDGHIYSDPNTLQIGSGAVQTTNDKLTVIGPPFVVGTK